MNPIYLEPDEEITSVIDKIKAQSGKRLAVVVPKNSTLFQSLVNLKLLGREAKNIDKTVVLISANKVGQKLARQVGLETYASLGSVGSTPSKPEIAAPQVGEIEESLPEGIKVHRYEPPSGGSAQTAEEESASEPVAVTKPEEPIAEPESLEPVAIYPAADSSSDSEPKSEEKVTDTDQPVPEPTPVKHDEPALPAIVSRGGFKTYSERHMPIPWKSLIVAGAIVLIGLLVIFLFLPKATVTVRFAAEPLTQTLTLNAKTVADAEDSTIVGNLLEVEKAVSKTVTATGKKDIGTKATGTVPIKNCEDTNSHAVAAGSKLTASEKTFVTNTAYTIPAGQFSGGGTVCSSPTVNMAITASEAGDAYNVSNGTFTVNGLSSRISGAASTTGGTTKQVTVLSQEDADKALAELKTQLINEATTELQGKAEGQTLLGGATKETIKEQKTDKAVGAQVDSATAQVTLLMSAIVFDKNTAIDKLKTALATNFTEDEQLVMDEQEPTLTFKSLNNDRSTMELEINGSGFKAPKLDKRAVAAAIKNKSSAKAQTILEQDYQATSADIQITPSWWPNRLPVFAQAISVDYGFVSNADTVVPETE